MERYFGTIRACVPIAAALLLAACVSDGPAPVEDLGLDRPTVGPGASVKAEPRPARAPGNRYRVQRGDTLYSIAFRHGLDYRELADWNGIGPPYTILVGQELRTTPTATRTLPTAPTAPRPADATRPPRTPDPATPKPAPFETVTASAATASAGPAPTTAATAAATTPPPVAPTATPVPAPAAPPVATPPPAAVATVGEITWRWPADGQLVGTYAAGSPTRQGIDIAGRSGDPVRAAADGAVVYSGNGLIGYGELIIVKHNASFLSAYGHNRKRLVQEGDRVRAGQTIAEMGSSSANRDSLHFEIRKNGKPVNPVDYLPRR